MAEDTNTAGGVPAPDTESGGPSGVKKLFTKIKTKINSLLAARRNSEKKLDDKKKDFNDKKSKILKFLLELIAILGIVPFFIRKINEFLGKGKKYDSKLKKTLIECFNSNIACNLEDTFKNTQVDPTPYFMIDVKKLDFFGILKIDPNSNLGKIFYGGNEITLNKAIKTAIDSGQKQNWNNIISVKYDVNTDLIDIYVNSNYQGKPVSTFINDLVNKINLIPKVGLTLNLMDDIYGSFSASIKPNKIDPKSLFNKVALDKFVEKILDGGEDLEIDDSFFSFSNEELYDIERTSINLANNFLEIVSCNNAESVITGDDLYPMLQQIISAGTFNEEVEVIEAGMTNLQILASKNVNRVDIPKFQIEFYSNIFAKLTSTLSGLVYSPQFLILMMIYFKLAETNPGGPEPIKYDNFVDFLVKTKNVLKCIIWSYFKLIVLLIVLPIIMRKLISEANKERIERSREKYELYSEQYLAAKGLLGQLKNAKLLRDLTSGI